MEKMINLKDLLVHEVQDLYSAEEQIIEALPKMIEKAGNAQLKKALQDHLKVTEQQKKRLDQVQTLLTGGLEEKENGQKKGLFSSLFGGGKSHKCRGTEGLIEEGEKVMGENMTPEVSDAAIIACAQKIEHYEICGYGTARAYARELNLGDVAELLEQTLNEEYEADDLLTDLAVGRLNEKAQEAGDDEEEGDSGSRRSGSRNNGSSARKGSSANKSSSANKASSASKGSSARTKSASSAKSNGKSNSSKASKSASKSAKSKSASGRSKSSRSR